MRRPKYRLSPNEVERLVKEETEQRRKLRIVQVREQAKNNAARVRNDVRREKARLLDEMASEIKDQLEAEKGEKLRKLEEKYEDTLRTIGEGHREVHLHGDGQNFAQRMKQKKEAEFAAQERFKVALEKEKKDFYDKEFKENQHIYARQAALETERMRAAQIASLPAPPPDISLEIEKCQKKAIPMVDMKAFATTHYHIPDYQVVKAGQSEQTLYDAKVLAEETDLRLKQDLQERRRALHEQAEKARIRGNKALEAEILKHDYGDMLQDLSLLQRQDRRRRKDIVADLPKQVYIPAERCMEERREREQEMERKFDEMYMQQHNLDSDQLLSMEMSDYASGLGSGESTLDARASILAGQIPLDHVNPALRDASRSGTSQSASNKQPKTVLKQLLNRIKEQRTSTVVKKSELPQSVANVSSNKSVVNVSAMSGDSRAAWTKSVSLGSPVVQDITAADSTMEDQSVRPDKPPVRPDRPAVTAASGGTTVAESLVSGDNSAAISNNERLIEELRYRIDLIESEKKRLAAQFQKHQVQTDGVLAGSPGSGLAESTLREIDIDNTLEDTIGSRRVVSPELPPELVSAAANLRPVRNSQFDIVASNGFPPLPETVSRDMEESDRDEESRYVETEAGSLVEAESDGGLASILRQVADTAKGVDLDSRDETSVSEGVKIDNLTTFLPSFPSASHNSGPRSGMTVTNDSASLPSMSHHAQWLGTRQPSATESEELSRKVQEYQAAAAQRQLSIDEETMRKVRDYQQKLLATEPQRKSMLADIRADIERRREELMSSQTTALSRHAESIYRGLTGANSRQQTGDDVTTSLTQDSMKSVDSSGTLNPDLALRFDPKTWEPIKPFVADQKLRPILTEAKGEEPSDSDVSTNLKVVSGDRKTPTDKIRKSLMFDEELMRSEPQSPAAAMLWKDVLNETSASSAHEDSRLTSSEEERGSPVLPGRWSSGSRLESSGADKSCDMSLGNGSSSLNGSALMARAEERREGFERRQVELREQLDEIQKQKDLILQRYQESQSMLSHRGGGTTQLRQKLAEVNLKLGEEGVATGRLQQSNVSGGALRGDGVNNQRASGRRSTGSERGSSGRGSTGSNVDSYLEDISFQRIKSPAVDGVPAAFPNPNVERRMQELTTWASVLSSSDSSFETDDRKSGLTAISLNDSTLSKSSNNGTEGDSGESRGKDIITPVFKEKLNLSSGDSLAATSSVASTDVSAAPSVSSVAGTPWSQVLMEHRPHELSTIVEVDTPTGSSTRASSHLRHGGWHPTGSRGEADASGSSQSLSSGSTHSLLSHSLLSQKLTQSTGSLTKQATGVPGVPPESSGRRLPEIPSSQTKAKRSLDFSDLQETLESSQSFVELYPELTTSAVSSQLETADSELGNTPLPDLDETADIMSTPMPDLMELTTPYKTIMGQDDVSALSSFQISGYSDYVRLQGEQSLMDELNAAEGRPRPDGDASPLPATSGDLYSSSLPSMSLTEMSIPSDADLTNDSYDL